MNMIRLLLLLLTGCSGGEPVWRAPQAGEVVDLPAVQWRVVDPATMQQVYRNSGKTLADGAQLQGFAGTAPDGTHVVYTLAPKTVDDQVTCTLGHEMMHIAIGSYHK